MARILKYRGGGMAPNSAASRLAKMMRSYKNGGYVYAQGSDEVPTTLTPSELAILKKFGLSPNEGGEVPTGSSAPQAMTREEYLAFPENFMELFGVNQFLDTGYMPSEEARREINQGKPYSDRLDETDLIDYTDEQKEAIKKMMGSEAMQKFWSEVMTTPGGQKMNLPLTGHEWTRPKNLSWLGKEDEYGDLGRFGSGYNLPKKMMGGDYYYPDQPRASIYYNMMSPEYQKEYARLNIDPTDPDNEERQQEMLNWFGSPLKRHVEQRMIEEAIRAKMRAQEAGVLK